MVDLAVTRVPSNPKIYHITHLQNLTQMVSSGRLLSDAMLLADGTGHEIIGMSSIKARRMTVLGVDCHPGTKVGEYVPFYFCPRSIMLYILRMANHPDLSYRGGERPILHLQADMAAAIRWAEKNDVRWAFSDRNAGGYLASFYNDTDDLDKVNWTAVAANDWCDPLIKEGKQAEFLVYESFPWEFIERIGVKEIGIERRVNAILQDAEHKPLVTVEPTWYYG